VVEAETHSTMATPADRDPETAGAPAAPFETAAAAEQTLDKKTGKDAKHKAQMDAVKQTVKRALGQDDTSNLLLLERLEKRFDEAGVPQSTTEVRFTDLSIAGSVNVGARSLPSMINDFINLAQWPLSAVGIKFANKRPYQILKDVSGVLTPGRMTLLLGPPQSGKSTVLKALSGRLHPSGLSIQGQVTYNGRTMDDFVVERASTYIEQVDEHMAELTVRETIDFAARVQGTGVRVQELQRVLGTTGQPGEVSGMLKEARNGSAGEPSDSEIDAFLKGEAILGKRFSVVAEYVLKVLGLDYVADTFVGGPMLRGISGGQKKRLTTGEMLVSPSKVIFADEISTGLDSSTTFQIIQNLSHYAHKRKATIMVALLQPAPEVYNLFDDILLLAEGHIVYFGPKEEVMPFFNRVGFQLPERKGIADFLQEVTSPKDQGQYWSDNDRKYKYVSVQNFINAFANTDTAKRTQGKLAAPVVINEKAEDPLTKRTWANTQSKLLKATLRREFTLIQRTFFIYIFRSTQVAFNAIVSSTLFLRTRLHPTNIDDANLYLAVTFFTLTSMLFNNWAEFAIIGERLSLFYKQRDNKFYPTWAFALPNIVLLQMPQGFMESLIWSVISYWVVGLAPEAGRFFFYWLVTFLFHTFAVSIFRLCGAAVRPATYSVTSAVFATSILMTTGAYIMPRKTIPGWWVWAYWINPMAWAQQALAINEFTAPRWNRPSLVPGLTLGQQLLSDHSYKTTNGYKWAAIGMVLFYTILLNCCIWLALAVLKDMKQPAGVMSEEVLAEKEAIVAGGAKIAEEAATSRNSISVDGRPATSTRSIAACNRSSMDSPVTSGRSLAGAVNRTSVDGRPVSKHQLQPAASSSDDGTEKIDKPQEAAIDVVNLSSNGKVGAGDVAGSSSALPFDQLHMTFNHVYYRVPLPGGMEEPAGQRPEDAGQLSIINDISGAFRPNVLTAFMGETGAGKTTLLDVLADRKTGGHIEGDIRVNGHKKEADTFARVSGYVEQTDIHSPQTTVHEALIYSAYLRLPGKVSSKVKDAFVEEIMEVVELTPIRNSLVGLPGMYGLSVEQRKRLTIAVELVANPSIVFMDEPTSGLDARAAAIVMRTVRNTVDTGRTVVCTIHQPSIDIFEAFDELLLIKRGGRTIFFGETGHYSANLINYFEAIESVPKISEDYNPATWMLEVANHGVESRTGQDFAELYNNSDMRTRAETMIRELEQPEAGSEPVHFPNKFAVSRFSQLRTILWKNRQVYWRYTEYNTLRVCFVLVMSLFFGTAFWQMGERKTTRNDILTIAGAMFISTMFLGCLNACLVQPVISVERGVFYRERAAGYYAALPYSAAQFLIEVPYMLFMATFYTLIVYSMIGFDWQPNKFFWFLFFEYLALSIFVYFGILSICITPNMPVAYMFSGTVYFMFSLMCGFIIAEPDFPGWWVWLYYLNPVSWLLYGFVGSQLGQDMDLFVTPQGTTTTVKAFLKDNFNYEYDRLYICVVVLLAYLAIFWLLSATALKRINFQKR
jgi:ABC-type multidrug transport system ATPase subunit